MRQKSRATTTNEKEEVRFDGVSLGLGFWVSRGERKKMVGGFGFLLTDNEGKKFEVYLLKQTDNNKGWEPDFGFLFGPNTAQLSRT